MKQSELTGGFARIEITPPPHAHISGMIGILRRPEYVKSPLYARVMLLEAGSVKLCLIALDVTIVTGDVTALIRRQVNDIVGAPVAIMVHAVQNHTAPGVGYFMLDESVPVPPDCEWLRGGESFYRDFLLEKLDSAVRAAMAAREVVTVEGGRSVVGYAAFNRRAVSRRGGVFMPSELTVEKVRDELLRLEGPIDPEVSVVAFRNSEGHIVGLLQHYSCHPVCDFTEQPVIAGDWPGGWCAALEKHYPEAVALTVNGSCGNLNPRDPFRTVNVDLSTEEMVAPLETAALDILTRCCPEASATLAVANIQIALPYREPEAEELGDRLAYYRAHPEIQWSEPERVADYRWFMAANITGVLDKIRRSGGVLQYELQAFRIGNFVICGLPGEPFSEGQLELKRHFPDHLVLVAHCANHYAGYLPTREAFAYPVQQRGHEANFSSWSNLEHGALDQVVAAGIALIAGLFKEDGR